MTKLLVPNYEPVEYVCPSCQAQAAVMLILSEKRTMWVVCNTCQSVLRINHTPGQELLVVLSRTPAPYAGLKAPELRKDYSGQCDKCHAPILIPADNTLPTGWQWFRTDGDKSLFFCPRHNTNVMALGMHADLYSVGDGR